MPRHTEIKNNAVPARLRRSAARLVTVATLSTIWALPVALPTTVAASPVAHTAAASR